MKKNSIFSLITNFSYTLSSNLISLVISSLVILVIPKLIGVEEYGYWQLYLFYTSYVGFLHFGWNDGIYLRYGGENYNNLDKKLFFSQFWMLFILQFLLTALIFLYTYLSSNKVNEDFIYSMTALNLLLINTKGMLQYILQSTNRLKEFSNSMILDRLVYAVLIASLIIAGINQYQIMIYADLFGKFISLLYTMYICRDIVFQKLTNFYFSIKETFDNIRVGIKLMFANIASSLILGIVKFGIERTWSVAIFGKISLTLSISNLIMIFVNALSLAVFPILRRTELNKLNIIYPIMRTALMTTLLALLLVYYPLNEILSVWLPEYSKSLDFMALIFPMILYEGKAALLTNTYLKTLRKEKIILRVNLITVITSIFTTLICTLLMKNLNLTILSFVFLLAFKSTLAEFMLSKFIDINIRKDILLETFMAIIFILTGWFINSWIGVVIYIIFYVFYLIIKRKDILKLIKTVKYMIKQ